MSKLMEVAGIDVVGPLPADLQSPDLVYMAGAPAASERPLPAKSLIDFLTAPAAACHEESGIILVSPGRAPRVNNRATILRSKKA